MGELTMLDNVYRPSVSQFELDVYHQVVPRDHYLQKALKLIAWESFKDLLTPYYSRDEGRPAIDPVMMLKLEFLRYHHNLSDREVIARTQTDLGFRLFLGLPLRGRLPDPSSLCIFRGRLGTDGFRKIFDQVIRLAREQGFVKDRLRVKDATHVIADVAVPTALTLVAQVRDKLLEAAERFAPLMVEGERVNLELLRESTKSLEPTERLAARVAHLKELLLWIDELTPPPDAEDNHSWQAFLKRRDLSHKILRDHENPRDGDHTVSITDPDARRFQHGDWFEGYMLDIMMDPDSEIITQVNVLAGAGQEARDALELIRSEESAQGNDVQALSMDGAGFVGRVLRELEDPEGLNVDTYVPVPKLSENALFTPLDFPEDKEHGVVTCPAGQTSVWCHRDNYNERTKYIFSAATCAACPLLARCMKNAPKKTGRMVYKSDYQVEHQRARHKTTTPEYAAVRHDHWKVERKLGEVANRHGGRRARYRGKPKVLIQAFMATMATNVKRMVRLHCARTAEISFQA
jgi:IS5 family transposase